MSLIFSFFPLLLSPCWSGDSLFSLFHMQGMTGSEMARASWWTFLDLCVFSKHPEITQTFKLKNFIHLSYLFFSLKQADYQTKQRRDNSSRFSLVHQSHLFHERVQVLILANECMSCATMILAVCKKFTLMILNK